MKLEGYTYIEVDTFTRDSNMTLTGDKLRTLVQVPIVSDLTEENSVFIPRGERVVQGIFVKYSVADNCNSDNDRVGGIGSTNK